MSKKNLVIFAAIAAASLSIFWSTDGHAWDFSCSPENVTEIETDLPPKIMMMLDKSGSMDWGERDRTCRACEEPNGNRYEVTGFADCQPQGASWDITRRKYEPRNNRVSGYMHYYSITGFPVPDFDPVLDVALMGDFADSCEFAWIYIDGNYVGGMNPGGSDCSTVTTATFDVPPSAYADGEVEVWIQTSWDRNYCGRDGVDARCGTQYTEVTLAQRPAKYLGTITDDDPCGSEDKWDQAVSAINRVSQESSSLDPDLAHFGLARFSGDSNVQIEVECNPDTYPAISSTLAALSPGGGTPTGQAIHESANSACVQDTLFKSIELTQSVPRDPSNNGYDLSYSFTGVAPQTDDAILEVDLYGDYNSGCEFADVYADGVRLGRAIPNMPANCNNYANTIRFTVPAAYLDDGQLEVVLDNRSTWDATVSPSCGSGTGGVNAHCNDNRGVVRLKVDNDVRQSAASILITDGEPTKWFGGRDPRHASVYEACQHRAIANLYVVGLGSGTDQEFNEVLAAAGGTGECTIGGVKVDPCDNPGNWSLYKGNCSGAFQTDSSDALLQAIADITAELQCVYDVNFTNAPVTEVPEDTSNEYPYLDVGFYPTTGDGRLYHKDSPLASPPGEGWDFASSTVKDRVKFTDHYCNQVRSRTITKVTTQLACLCKETPGTPCTVPNAAALGVCEEGTWTCQEGIDICEPVPDCCTPGLPCDTGLLGVCGEGVTTCTAGVESCMQVNTPTEEVCNGLDDDCDGLVDEIEGDCMVPGAVGRCIFGTRACVGNDEICAPLFDPMPELCNGLDDDCDGSTDNITDSWEDPVFASYTLPPGRTQLACEFRNSCMCPGGVSDDHEGNSFPEYVAKWDPVCQCGAGLESPQSEASAAAGETGPATGCSSAGSPEDGLALFVMLFGLGLLARRRD